MCTYVITFLSVKNYSNRLQTNSARGPARWKTRETPQILHLPLISLSHSRATKNLADAFIRKLISKYLNNEGYLHSCQCAVKFSE